MPKTTPRKKASKKISSKSASGKGAAKRTTKKSAAKKSTGFKSRQLVDEVLVKVSPQVQKRVDQLIDTLNNTKEARLGDLKWLAGQILLRSKEISSQLKNIKVGTSRKKNK